MQLKKRVAAEHQLGNLSFSGGIETRLMGRKFGRTPVATFRYADQDNSYGLHVYGKNVNFDIDTKHVDTEVEWKPSGVKFNLHLAF